VIFLPIHTFKSLFITCINSKINFEKKLSDKPHMKDFFAFIIILNEMMEIR
jgi:hypothetical protein